MDAKPVKKIDACYMNLQIGQPAYVGMNGRIMETSPVQRYNVSAGRVYIETQNSVYTNMELSVKDEVERIRKQVEMHEVTMGRGMKL